MFGLDYCCHMHCMCPQEIGPDTDTSFIYDDIIMYGKLVDEQQFMRLLAIKIVQNQKGYGSKTIRKG